MKHITPFNESVQQFVEFTQNLSETISAEQFKNLKPKKRVKYKGTPYTVQANDNTTVTLKHDDGETI